MNQNSELKENIEQKPTVDILKPAETSLSRTDGQRILLPEFSNLMTWVSQITNQNFELLKMARTPGNDIGMGRFSQKLTFTFETVSGSQHRPSPDVF